MEIVTWLSQALTSVLTGEQTVEAAMRGVQEKAEAALAAQEIGQ